MTRNTRSQVQDQGLVWHSGVLLGTFHSLLESRVLLTGTVCPQSHLGRRSQEREAGAQLSWTEGWTPDSRVHLTGLATPINPECIPGSYLSWPAGELWVGNVHKATLTFLFVASTNRHPQSSRFCLFSSLSKPAFINSLDTNSC